MFDGQEPFVREYQLTVEKRRIRDAAATYATERGDPGGMRAEHCRIWAAPRSKTHER